MKYKKITKYAFDVGGMRLYACSLGEDQDSFDIETEGDEGDISVGAMMFHEGFWQWLCPKFANNMFGGELAQEIEDFVNENPHPEIGI